LPLAIYTFGFSLVIPVVTIESLDLVPHRRGLAASLQGFSHVLVFALISSLVVPLVYRSGPRHAVGLAALMLVSYLSYVGGHAAMAAGERTAHK
jgi:MFS transporter, DHA1 family, multidrug resistance protein